MTDPKAWPPCTEDQLRRAAETGLLAEGQKLDLKREMPANRDLAKDIAAFSLYGGTIIIGVDEKPPPAPPELHPVELDGLSERISQIATTRVDEAVIVTTTAIDSSSEPGKGYLVVEVPASPRGPHMADGKYYRRADKTNRVLPHAEVLQHHERQIRENKDILVDARAELESMKANISFHTTPMLLRAKPLGATDGLLMALAVSDSWQSDIRDLVQAAAVPAHQQFVPSLRDPTGFSPRPTGPAATTNMLEGNHFGGSNDAAEVIFGEDGSLTLVSERAVAYPTSDGGGRIMESVYLGHADLIVRLAGLVSKYGFNGSWRFAIVTAGLRGARSYILSNELSIGEAPVYTETRYEQATTATNAEIINTPEMVVRGLLGRLIRSLGSTQRFPWVWGH